MQNPISIFLLIRSLNIGGAERQLVELARGLRKRECRVTVATFYSPEPLGAELERAAIPVVDLRKTGRWDTIGFSRRLWRAIKDARPDVVYSFLGGGNIFAAAVRPFTPGPKLVWSIRSSERDLSQYDWAHRLSFAIERRLARFSDLVIANSHVGRQFAERNGFPRRRIAVVPNGIDISRFRPDAALRKSQRAQWNVTEGTLVVGMLARLDPIKGQADFLRAAAQVASRRNDVKFICVGSGPDEQRLKGLSAELGIMDRVLFPGPTENPAAILNGLDLFCSASITEGFSNSIAEAMACGLPCVVTDAGDSARIVDGCGAVVPRSSPGALADAILQQLDEVSRGEATQGRARVVENFSIDAMVDRTLALLRDLAASDQVRSRL